MYGKNDLGIPASGTDQRQRLMDIQQAGLGLMQDLAGKMGTEGMREGTRGALIDPRSLFLVMP